MAPVSKPKGKKVAAAEKDEDFIKVQKEVEEEEDAEDESDDDDESDEDESEEEEEGDADEQAETGEASTKKPKTKANRLKEMQDKDDDGDEPSEPRGVIYLGHIPQGFFEPQMRTFFSQFGTITRLRLSRSKKNAALKGYGFIEFEEESVAKIVADTMHKYLLFGKQLVCHLIPPEKQHKKLFKGSKFRMSNRSHLRRNDARALYNDRPTVANADGSSTHQSTRRQAERRNVKEKKLRLALESLGIDFDANAASGGVRVPARKPKKDRENETALAATAAAVAAAAKVAKSAAPAKAKSPKAAPVESPKAVPAKVDDKKRKQAPASDVSKGQALKKKAKRKAA